MPRWIAVPVPTDPQTARDTFDETIRQNFPAWQAVDADPMTLVRNATAELYADAAELATSMGEEAFRFMGTIAGLPPIDALPAVGQAEFTAQDTDGPYTVPEGLEIVGRTALGEPWAFRVLSTGTIANGSSTVTVDVEAIIEGADGNDIDGTAEFDEYVSYLTAVAFVAPTTGGVDAESDEEYLERLSAEFELFSPRPILPEHFETLARRLGAYRAMAYDGLAPGESQAAQNQRVMLEVDATSGNFSLQLRPTPGGTPTAYGPFSYSTAAATIDAALPAAFAVTGGPLNTAPVIIESIGAWAELPGPLITVTGSTLAGGTGASTVLLQVGQPAATGTEGNPATVAVAMIDEAGDDLSDAATIAAELAAMREVGFAVHYLPQTRSAIDVTWSGTAWDGFEPADVEEAGNAALAEFLSPAVWGSRLDTGETREWENTRRVALFDVASALLRVEGLRTLDSLEIALAGDTLAASDVDLPGFAPLTEAGDIAGSVS